MPQPSYLISTPENVDLHFELAGLGNRIFACVVDTSISWGLIVVVMLTCFFAISALEFFPLPERVSTIASYYLIGVAIILVLAVNFGYFIFFEGAWQGQTPGKRLTQIRVIEQNGQPVSWSSVFIRNLLRVVDTGFVLIGLLIMLIDGHERRLGDFAANTLVIKEHLSTSLPNLQIKNNRTGKEYIDVGRLSAQDYDLLRSFLERRAMLSPEQRPLLSFKLENYYRKKLEAPLSGQSPEFFLEAIYLAYKARAQDDLGTTTES